MIYCDELNKEFETKEEMFKELKTNKHNLISLKKSSEKRADAISCGSVSVKNENAIKTIVNKDDNKDSLEVKAVINTTNFMDSHGDVHIDGLWNKSIKDNKSFLHLQEHNRDFGNVISSDAKGSVKSILWKDLGYNFKGSTEALIFDSTISKSRNEFMLNQYKNGWVTNHSVGMRYVKMELAMNSNSEYDKEEYAVWQKYYDVIANKDLADEKGYFWAVTEAKIIEGSAVVMGSNSATPTLETKEEPSKDTLDKEVAEKSLQTEMLKELLNKF